MFGGNRQGAYRLKEAFHTAYVFGIAGFYYQIHRILLDSQNEGIGIRTAGGFLLTAGIGFLLYPPLRFLSRLKFSNLLKQPLSQLASAIPIISIVYFAYVLWENSRFLFVLTDLRHILVLYLIFLGTTAALSALLKHKIVCSFTMATLLIGAAAGIYVSLRLGALPGFFLAFGYVVYLICLGCFTLDSIERLIDLEIETVLIKSILSFILGVLTHYLVWYALGLIGLLYPLVASVWIGFVLILAAWQYGNQFLQFARQRWGRRSQLMERAGSETVLVHPAVFCLLLLFMLLCLPAPGHIDSRVMTYGASMYGFAKLHRIVILPFQLNWPLLFQPLLFEITGLPIFLVGGISAWRIFNGLCFFSFVPVLILLCREYGLPKRLVILMVILYLASSFTFRMSYSDKPEVIGFPAFLSFVAIGLLSLKRLRAWHLIALGGLMAVIFNTKLVLIAGTLASFLIIAVFFLTSKSKSLTHDIKKAALISSAIVLVACSLVPAQNMLLRENPFHPFTAATFGVSDRVREESEYTIVPRHYYRKTMPVQMPSRIAGINLDVRRGMYQPFVKAMFSGFSVTYGPTRDSISVAIILCCVLAPLFLSFNPDRLMFACSSVTLMSFFIWFSWIGDGFRYTTAFPAMCLLTAVALGGDRLPHSRFLAWWRNAATGLLLASIPFALGATFEERTSAEVLRFCMFGGAKPGVLEPMLHPVTDYLEDHAAEKPVLLVADSRVPKYGLYQPSFFFQPHFYSHKTISLAYVAKIKPTHLLTTRISDESILVEKYPFLRNYLVLDKSFETGNEVSKLYRFEPEVPWDRYFEKFSDIEPVSPTLVREIDSFMTKYRNSPALPDAAN